MRDNPVAVPGTPDRTGPDEQPRQAFVEQIMGLPVSVHVRGPRARGEAARRAVHHAFAALRADDAMFSTWKPDSPISQIRSGTMKLGDAPARVQEVRLLCDEAYRRTGGRFSAWLPRQAQLPEPLGDGPVSEPSSPVLDPTSPVFDPTGLVKGWAVQQAFGALRSRLDELGAHDLLVSAGGDVLVACTRTDTPDWRIGIEDPRDRSRILLTVPLRSGAVATSGTAARGRHIIDPSTGVPARGLLSATVIGPDLTWADVYATAAFAGGPDSAQWVRALPDHTGVLVRTDGQVQFCGSAPE